LKNLLIAALARKQKENKRTLAYYNFSPFMNFVFASCPSGVQIFQVKKLSEEN
jgi:hypothetical protein